MRARVWGVAVRMTRLTTFAGSSSIMSTASSTYIPSTIPASSESVMELMMRSCSGGSRLEKTSAAFSLDRRRKTMGIRLSPSSVRNSATSNSLRSSSRSWSFFISWLSSSSLSS